MEDRLADLKIGVKSPDTTDTKVDEIMPEFNRKTNLIHYYLNKVKDNNKEVYRLRDKHKTATLSEQEKNISDNLDRLINENAKLCGMIKDEMQYVEEDIKRCKEKEPDEPETRIKDITYRALKGKFSDVLKESQNAQIELKTAVKTKIARQAKIIDPTLTEEQVEAVCSDPDGAAKLLQSKMLGSAHVRVKNAVADIQDKYKDIIKLEKSVQMIHQMFVDMQMLVQAQGEMLDNIEIHIEQATDYVKKANVQLAKGKKSHILYKKYRCCLLITLLVIIAIVVIVPLAMR